MAYVIAEPCVDTQDRVCVDECPIECIYDGYRKRYVHPDECVDCGVCGAVCPVGAVFREDELPSAWTRYAAVEREFFEVQGLGLGTSPGAFEVGRIDWDHPAVAQLPPSGALGV